MIDKAMLPQHQPTREEIRKSIQIKYINFLSQLSGSNKKVIAVDVSGMATNFCKWTTDDYYKGILNVNRLVSEEYNRKHGKPGVIRIFAVDPDRISDEGICNLEELLRQHVAFGIEPGIILTTEHEVREGTI